MEVFSISLYELVNLVSLFAELVSQINNQGWFSVA
jgi:hypothetical protein